MIGYPKHLNTKQDIDYIGTNHPEIAKELEKDLEKIISEPDTVKRTISISYDTKGQPIDEVTVTMPNPNPTWKKMGFKDKSEVQTELDKVKPK